MRRPEIGLLIVVVCVYSSPALAVRGNMRRDIGRLEQMGRFDEVLFYRQSTRDVMLAIHIPWSGVAFDPAMDKPFFETRVDRRYWNMVHGQTGPIDALLKKSNLTHAQLDRLDERVRIYVEDHLSPEFDEMGNFYLQRKAWLLERHGLFWDASYRRRLTGQYEMRVCVPYYTAMSAEMRQKGQDALAQAYQRKSEWFEAEAMRQFHRANGDRLISQRQEDVHKRLSRAEVIALLKSALASELAEARYAAAAALIDLGQPSALASLADDADALVRQTARAALAPRVLSGHLPGALAEYYTDPGQTRPVAGRVLPAVEIGFRGNERFSNVYRAMWDADDVVPPNASGPFLVKLGGMIEVPEDGSYRFYIKTDSVNRATLRLGDSALGPIISPRNDRQLLFTVQNGYDGQVLTRIDYSLPVELKMGLVPFQIQYQGPQAKGQWGTPGLKLYWSSQTRVMEPVPARALFHAGQ